MFGLNELQDSKFNFKLCIFTFYFCLSHCLVIVWLLNENVLPILYFTSRPANFNTGDLLHLPKKKCSKNNFKIKGRMESSMGWFFIYENIFFRQDLSIFTNTSAMEQV